MNKKLEKEFENTKRITIYPEGLTAEGVTSEDLITMLAQALVEIWDEHVGAVNKQLAMIHLVDLLHQEMRDYYIDEMMSGDDNDEGDDYECKLMS